jgi:Tfp pilus assembly protein PilZ
MTLGVFLMRERASDRFVPRRPVTVAFESKDSPRAYGVVANLSEGGCCVWSDAHLKAGQKVTLAVSFARASRPVPAPARVVWTGPGSKPGASRYGVEFDAAAAEYFHLRRLITESA